jgi:hypothetical protein
MYTVIISTLFYERKIDIGKHRYVFMCDFGILSQGLALTNSGNLTYFELLANLHLLSMNSIFPIWYIKVIKMYPFQKYADFKKDSETKQKITHCDIRRR